MSCSICFPRQRDADVKRECVGLKVGMNAGDGLKVNVTRSGNGDLVGVFVSCSPGDVEGLNVRENDGDMVGDWIGDDGGAHVGEFDGFRVKDSVGNGAGFAGEAVRIRQNEAVVRN